MSNLNRRDFVKKTLATGTAITIVPRFVMGGSNYTQPSEKIQVAIIGTGSRMNLLLDAFLKQPDCTIAALCDVDSARVNAFASNFNIKADIFGDYRRILERDDIDAVVVATPDHWHSPIAVSACMAGKDVYLEKPVSNTVEAAVKILDAAKWYNSVVQVGTQQRSWPHFQECAKMIQDGLIGEVHQVVVNHGTNGGYGATGQPSIQQEPIPEGFDWEMFQGPAPRHPYSSARRRWRSYYDYGGGSITDWGVHHIDIVHMALQYDVKGPTFTSAATLANPDPELVPGTFSISYKYDDFVMTFESCTHPSPERINGGPAFFGSQGYLVVTRSGYKVRPFRGRGATSAIEPKDFEMDDPVAGERASEVVHVRNWMDCIKSCQKPTVDIETGFYSSLPCILGVQAVREERALIWDPHTKTARPV